MSEQMIVSRNIPGYMPMDDEPIETDLASALDALTDDVTSMLDDGWELSFSVQTPTAEYVLEPMAPWDTFKSDLRTDIGVQLMEREEAHVWVFDTDREHDLGIHFWAVEGETA